MFRPNLESGLDAQVHDRMKELNPEPAAVHAVHADRRANPPAQSPGPVRRARRSVGRALVVLGTQVAGGQPESRAGGRRQAA